MATPLTIRQLEPPRKAVFLLNSCAPLSPVEQGTEQRGDVAYFKGSPIGRARLDGSQEDDVEFTFVFRDRYMSSSSEPFRVEGKPNAIKTAIDGREFLREMVRDAVMVLVDWQGKESVGYLQRVGGSDRRFGEEDISLVYRPTKPDRNMKGQTMPLKSDPADMLGQIRENWLNFLTTARVPAQTGRGRIESLQRVSNAVNQAISEAAAVLSEYQDNTEDVLGLSNGLTGPLRSISRESDNFDLAVATPSAAGVQTDDAVQIIAMMTLNAEAQEVTRRMRQQATQERRRLELLEREDIIGKHLAIADEDLRLVCLNNYGRSDVWPQVADFNGLRGSVLTAGQTVYLPRIDERGVLK